MFLVLIATAWLLLSGAQDVRDLGDMARFGNTLFAILAPLQLVLAMFFSAIFAAGNVSQEKDRNTLVLLLLTRIRPTELVVGKLAASLVHLFSNFLAVMPIFFAILTFGGVDLRQVLHCVAITLTTILLCGTLGTFVAFWREQTFQALAISVLLLVVWLVLGEALAFGLCGEEICGWSARTLAETISPWRAILAITVPMNPMPLFPGFACAATLILGVWNILRVRAWNVQENRFGEPTIKTETAVSEAKTKQSRAMWTNPVLWREVRTHAYGRRAFLVRLAFTLIFALAAVATFQGLGAFQQNVAQEHQAAMQFALRMFVPLALLGLVLVNAQAVTAITGERSGHAIDLLLVTDLSPREILFGKLGGVFWNTREMVVLPLAFLVYFCAVGLFSLEITAYLFLGLGVLYLFAAVLGIHSGMTYAANRSAIGVSLGTLFFLFVGVAVCLRMMLSLGGSFQAQLQPFLAFMVGGGVAMYLALGARNPSSAIGLASFVCPFATFYAMSALMMDYTLGVFLVVTLTYGFTTAAMLVPALSELDIAS